MERDLPNFAPTPIPTGRANPLIPSSTEEAPPPAVETQEPPEQDVAATSNTMDTSEPEKDDLESKFPGVVLDGLEQFRTQDLVRACVHLMSHDFDKDTLHAIMRVCLRLTRSFENAEVFAREGGIRLLLQMKQNVGYAGFTTLATLLIRHVIEEPKTLTLAMENVIFSRTLHMLPSGCKELLYMTRQMSSAISRNPNVFKEVAQQILRIDVEILKRNQLNEDNRYLLKSLHPTTSRDFKLEDPVAGQAVKDLLVALVQPDVPMTSQCGSCTPSNPKAGTSKHPSVESRREQSQSNTEMSRFVETFKRVAAGKSIDSAPKTIDNDKTLLSKADILKILGDAVRSYQTVSLLITQYVYKAGCVPGITEDTSALSYILDKLLYVYENGQDRACSQMAQSLIAGLASTSDVVSVQYAVVTEVKAALLRAFLMPESMEKHLQIEMIAGLIPVMIDSYVSADNLVLAKSQQSHSVRYNIFFIMLRKGLISDLAKVTQYLDLSGPHTVATINYILKPLELLVRMSNEPVATSMFNKKKTSTTTAPTVVANSSTNTATPSGAQSSTTSRPVATAQSSSTVASTNQAQNEEQQSTSGANPVSESTVAQDETMTDDSENTDYDISTVPESGIETTSEAQIQVDLSEILNTFLREDLNNENDANQISIAVGSHNDGDNDGDVEPENDQDGEYSAMRGEALDTSSESSDDSVSNGSENEGNEMEEEASENEDEADEHSELDVDEETRQFIEMYDQNVLSHHIRSPNLNEADRDNEDILMIQYAGNNSGENEAGEGRERADANVVNNASGAGELFTNRITFSQIVEEQRRRRLEASGIADSAQHPDPLANDDNSAAATSHPLLMRRHSTSQSQDGNSRNEIGGRRTGRSARAHRINYMNMNGRSTNPPIILQRLLGPSNSGTPGTVTLRDSTRVVLMDNAFSFIPGNDDDNGDNDHGSYMYGGRTSSTQSSNNNTALNWWFEESKILGLESQPDICLTICAELVPDLEKHKADDLAKNRTKRKKKSEEEEAAKREQGRATTSATIETRLGSIHVAPSATRTATQFAQALNLMDTSEPLPLRPAGDDSITANPIDATASTINSSTVENHNITATSSQLEEMQISQDSMRPEAALTPTIILNPSEQNQMNSAAENQQQQQGQVENRDTEMSDAADRNSRAAEESEDSPEVIMHSPFISIYSDEVNSDDDDDDSDDVS